MKDITIVNGFINHGAPVWADTFNTSGARGHLKLKNQTIQRRPGLVIIHTGSNTHTLKTVVVQTPIDMVYGTCNYSEWGLKTKLYLGGKKLCWETT